MKKTTFLAALLCAVVLLASCGGNAGSLLGGAAYPADKAGSYAKAIENVKEKTDLDKFKIFSVRFDEGEELSNDLLYVTVGMVNSDNRAFTQSFFLNGTVGDMAEYSNRIYVVDYEKINGIDITKINPEEVEGYFNEAKKLIPEGHTYKSISYYEIEEVLPKVSSLTNRDREIGSQETVFGICFTEDGKETETNAGKVTHLYFEAKIRVNPDGTLSAEE